LLQRGSDLRLVTHVVTNLRYLVPEHPDVAALGLMTGDDAPAGRTPPMFLASYQRGLLPADLRDPSVIGDGSALELTAAALQERGVWFTWAAGSLFGAPPIRRGGPVFGLEGLVRGREGLEDLPSAPLRRMQGYLDQVAAVEGLGGRAEAAAYVTPVGVARACSLPVGTVERLMPDV
jgi:hypothetical protein